MSNQSHLTPLIRVCQTVDVHLLLVLLNLLLQTTEFLTENHRAAGACVCVCVCVSSCVYFLDYQNEMFIFFLSVVAGVCVCAFLEGS